MGRRREAKSRRLGDVLVEHGLITREERRAALRRQRETGGRLGEVLVREGILTRDQLNWALGDLLHIPYVQPDAAAIDAALFAAFPLDLLRRCEAVPMARAGDEVAVAMADPTDVQAVADLQAAARAQLRVALADAAAIHRALGALAERTTSPPRPRIVLPSRPGRALSPQAALADASGSAFLRFHLVHAVREGADEILIEPLGEAFRVRRRLHGRVLEEASYPASALDSVVVRLRLMAGMASSTDAVVEDAAATLEVGAQSFDLLVSVHRSPQGPGARMVIRRRGGTPWPLSKLGVDRGAAARLQRAVQASAGLIVVCGPGRSGCSTTLYALLRAASAPGRYLVTLEHAPTHYWAEATQLAAPSASYLPALRDLVRRPPDVLLAEGLHEREFWAAFGPHTLASTLLLGEMRGADAVSALGQLRDLGLSGTLLATSLRAIVAQRLVHPSALRGRTRGHRMVLACEVLAPDWEFRALLLAGAPLATLHEAAERSGMRSLAACAEAKAARGLVDPADAESLRAESLWNCSHS
ncbi:MAG TPA: ATPase, T2SS/T4P/T4SS family [Planctomycetota bacterium]|nr:ATPase, T2SS/T4P/T4SS family [Planctomycetota bacterium]